MNTDDDGVSVSDRDTQFIPQENDAEELWEVIEITAEKGKQYKVKWAGVDPETRKPWPQSWVPKHDCTDDLVRKWKLRLAAKKEAGAERRKSVKRASLASGKPRGSTLRASTDTRESTISSAKKNDHSNVNGKRKMMSPKSTVSDNLSEDPSMKSVQPRKKRKLETGSMPGMDNSLKELGSRAKPTKGHEDDDDGIEYLDIEEDVSGKPKQRILKREEEATNEEPRKLTREALFQKELEERKAKAIAKKKGQLRMEISTTSSRSETSTKKVPLRASPVIKRELTITRNTISLPSDKDDEKTLPGLDRRGLPTSVRYKESTRRLERIGIRLSASIDDDSDRLPSSERPQRESSTLSQSYIPEINTRNPSPAPNPLRKVSPRLSPGSIARLEEFDAWMAQNINPNSPHSPAHDKEVPGSLSIDQVHDAPVNLDTHDESVQPIEPTTTAIFDVLPNPPNSTVSIPRTSSPYLARISPVMSHPPGNDEHDLVKSPHPVPKPTRIGNGQHHEDNSYRQGIVPETETQSSTNNTQSQLQPPLSPPQIIEPPKIASNVNTPTRPNLINRMKPRTPGSMNGSRLSLMDEEAIGYDPVLHDHQHVDGTSPPLPSMSTNYINNIINTPEKPLRPIPMLSPSKFGPHLPPTSSISNHETNEAEAEELMSSIEQFSSPEKSSEGSSIHPKVILRRKKGKEREEEKAQDTSITDDEDAIQVSIMERGQKMAEATRNKRLRREKYLTGEGVEQKKTLLELLKNQKDKRQRKGRQGDKNEMFKRHPTLLNSASGSDADGYINTEVHRSRQKSPNSPKSKSLQMDATSSHDLYNNPEEKEASIRTNSPDLDIMALREEEEESTQDLYADMRAGMSEVDVEMGFVDQSIEPDGPSHLHGSEPTDLGLMPTIATNGTTVEANPPGEEEDSQETNASSVKIPDNIPPPRSRATSRSNSKSVSDKSRTPIHEESQLILPPTALTRQNTPNSSLEFIPKDGPELEAAMTLLNIKSQEISKLDALLVAEQAKSEALSKELELLRAALVTANSEPRPRETNLELELTEIRRLFQEEKSTWDAERSKFVESLESSARGKTSAQKDCDFFREQYGKASSFVSSVRKENEELETRTRIAEEQATSGVALVKATFQRRVEQLEDDAKHWRKIAMFMLEKDQRTNDDIRRRAGEEPQLRRRCNVLKEENETLLEKNYELEHLRMMDEEEVKRLERDAILWKNETVRLNVELNEVQARLEGIRKDDGAPSGHEMVYRCQWRSEEGNDPCEGLFMSVEELQNHLYTGGHLHP